MPVLTAHLFALVYRHFMTFSLFSAGHIVSVFPLVLKADNIRTFSHDANYYSYSFEEPCIFSWRTWSGIHVFEKILVVFGVHHFFTHELHTLNRVLVGQILSEQPGSGKLFL